MSSIYLLYNITTSGKYIYVNRWKHLLVNPEDSGGGGLQNFF